MFFRTIFQKAKLPARPFLSLTKWTQCKTLYREYGIYEPDYLEALKSKIPLYPSLNIQLKGYDYPVLEQYQKYVHKIAEYMDIEVEDGWATPGQKWKIDRYKPQSTVLDSEYRLTIYERNIQVSLLESTSLPLLLQILAATLPEGVKLQIHEHQPEYEEVRYVPDHDLISLKTELESMTIKRK